MCRPRNVTLLSALGVVTLLTWACDGQAPPAAPEVDQLLLHIFPGEELACFRLTGGGRIDKPEPPILMAQPKNTPVARDFATFGFQARPVDCNVPDGSGQLEWVEHNPDAILGGFSFHSSVSWFVAVHDHYGDTSDPRNGCGRFSGNDGRAHGRDGQVFEGVSFIMEHACDRGEPGVGNDHLRICIGTADPTECNTGIMANGNPVPYRRDGILTGGNIQKHGL